MTADSGKRHDRDESDATWVLRLYVADGTPKSATAIANLHRFCDTYLAGRYSIEVIDVLEYPERSREDDVRVVPMLVRAAPEPVRRVVGDLSDIEKVMLQLDFFSSD